MRTTVILIISAIISCSMSAAENIDELKKLFRAAISSGDLRTLESETYTKGMSESDKDLFLSKLTKIEPGFETIEVTSKETTAADHTSLKDGKKFSPLIPPDGIIFVHLKKVVPLTNGSTVTQRFDHFLYATVDKQTVLIGIKSENHVWKGPPDRKFEVLIESFVTGIENIRIGYSSHGLDLARSTQNTATPIFGQSVNFVEFESPRDDFEGAVVIYTNDREVARSKRYRGTGKFSFIVSPEEPAEPGR